jgi:hypothetical protein
MAASYQASLTFPVGGEQLFQACMNALSQCGFSVTGADPSAGLISAKANMSFLSWGEIITLAVAPDGRVDMKSSCRGIQLIDYGKNKRNINALSAALSRAL